MIKGVDSDGVERSAMSKDRPWRKLTQAMTFSFPTATRRHLGFRLACSGLEAAGLRFAPIATHSTLACRAWSTSNAPLPTAAIRSWCCRRVAGQPGPSSRDCSLRPLTLPPGSVKLLPLLLQHVSRSPALPC